MTPYEYLSSIEEEEVSALAQKCNTTPLYLWKLARDIRRGKTACMHPRLAAKLECLSNKKVMRWESIPYDWHEIWPELIAHHQSPPLSAGVDRMAANDSQMERSA